MLEQAELETTAIGLCEEPQLTKKQRLQALRAEGKGVGQSGTVHDPPPAPKATGGRGAEAGNGNPKGGKANNPAEAGRCLRALQTVLPALQTQILHPISLRAQCLLQVTSSRQGSVQFLFPGRDRCSSEGFRSRRS